MENFYLFAVVLLFILAVFDLIVGVSNDAVNFLNSSIGSKVAKRQTIMIVASAGILIGAITSGGMMEVARKGIFNPQHFYFNEVMIIFLAVMITDIILLDLFNTLAMPTSTTVSIVFEILGAAFALSVIKVLQENDPMNFLFNLNNSTEGIVGFMNWSKAGTIILGILLSVVFAFSIGALVQYFSRWLFSFEYKKRMAIVGLFWCAMAFSFMFYFLIFKGLKSTYKEIKIPETEFVDYIKINNFKTNVNPESLPQSIQVTTSKSTVTFEKSDDGKEYKGLFGYKSVKKIVKNISENLWLYALIFYGIMVALIFVLQKCKVNILKLVVLFGTFCLAMAFAGNDLVNFIGIPVAGAQSFELFNGALESNPNLLPNEFKMFSLKFPQETPFFFLALAGIIMILTLWFSKKSRSVTETEVNLGAQSDVDERFKPNFFAYGIVNSASKANAFLNQFLPTKLKQNIERNFNPEVVIESEDKPAFDLIRASVNLAVASILIAIATNMKLPLSTTYVSFMVAMGTSLADRAWGRESAVYRVAGVMNVIGGWFLTAVIALTAAAIFATFMYFGGFWAIIIMVGIVAFMIYRSSKFHEKMLERKYNKRRLSDVKYSNVDDTLNILSQEVSNFLNLTITSLNQSFAGIEKEDKKTLKKANKNLSQAYDDFATVKNEMFKIIKKNKDTEVESSKLYVFTYDLMNEVLQSTTVVVDSAFTHVKNNHKPLQESQIEHFKEIQTDATNYLSFIKDNISSKNFAIENEVSIKKDAILSKIENLLAKQISGVKQKEFGFKNTSLYFNTLLELKDIIAVSARFVKMYQRVSTNKDLL